ncbi:MAG: hypothetical protein FWD05_03490 [Oscillospiraceae bacterium]|nr:hypothetical protein [Oscillospiraceae bacterium]
MNCGAQLHKSDIFCSRCNTPVLTEDDITLMPNAITTRHNNETQYSEHAHFSGDTQVSNTSDDLVTLSMPDNMQHSSIPTSSDGNTQRVNTQNRSNASNDEPHMNRKESSRKATIITIAVVAIAVIGVALFFLLHSRDNGDDGDALIGNNNEDYIVNDINGEINADYIQATPLEIASIVLFYSGRAQTEFHTRVSETITLRAQLLPDGLDYDISWESSDPDVLEINQIGQAGLEATITGVFPGVADIIVTAGDFVMYYVVFVDDYPLHAQLEAAINDEIEGVWLTVLWTSGEHNGQETSFIRARNDDTWIMHGVSDTREVHPIFNMESNAFTIGFPNTARIYYLFADGTGYFREPDDGAYAEDFIWWFVAADTDIEG